MKSLKALIVINLWKLGQYFQIYQKPFPKFGMKAFFITLNLWVSGELFNLFENYLSGRFQRFILNGQHSSWKPMLARIPQGPILGPLLFLIYINDLPNELKSIVKLLANDTSLFTKPISPFLNGLITGKCFLIQIQ